jgi:hypothetical protein
MFAKDIDVYESVKLQISHSQDSEDRMFAMASTCLRDELDTMTTRSECDTLDTRPSWISPHLRLQH